MSFVDMMPVRAPIKTVQYALNREHLLEYQKQWQKENHEVYIDYQKEYYQKTKEQKKEKYNVLVMCDCCKKNVRRGAMSVHRKTKKHVLAEAKLLIPTALLAKDMELDGETIVFKPMWHNSSTCNLS
jgi:hypothetical protein